MTTTHTFVEVNPAELHFGANVRHAAQPDEALIASIREHGVLEPIVATRGEDDTLTVLLGHRRTLAACQAGLSTVPVVISTQRDAAGRIVHQLAENDHRDGITNAERAQAFEQLAMIGMKATDIAKATATPRARVEAMAKVARSARADDLLGADLTIEQAAVIAKYADDAGDVERLMTAAASNYFDHEVARVKHDRQDKAERAAFVEEMTAAGITVIDTPTWADETTRRLSQLRTTDGEVIDPHQHAATCPGHAVAPSRTRVQIWRDTGQALTPEENRQVREQDREDQLARIEARESGQEYQGPQRRQADEEWRYQALPCCVAWASHGHTLPPSYGGTQPTMRAAEMEPAAREAARRERAEKIRLNKEWAAAQDVRRAWLTSVIAAKKSPPKDAAMFVARISVEHPALIGDYRTITLANELSGGTGRALAAKLDSATPARALVIAALVALAACEEFTDRSHWRQPSAATQLYLTTIHGWGYTLSEVEQRAAGTWSETPTDAA